MEVSGPMKGNYLLLCWTVLFSLFIFLFVGCLFYFFAKHDRQLVNSALRTLVLRSLFTFSCQLYWLKQKFFFIMIRLSLLLCIFWLCINPDDNCVRLLGPLCTEGRFLSPFPWLQKKVRLLIPIKLSDRRSLKFYRFSRQFSKNIWWPTIYIYQLSLSYFWSFSNGREC